MGSVEKRTINGKYLLRGGGYSPPKNTFAFSIISIYKKCVSLVSQSPKIPLGGVGCEGENKRLQGEGV